MELGFDTIGNATLIAYDREPVIATDPWVQGNAYFGSWGLSHEVPAEQAEAVERCPYVWFSHGHPDHLNADSLERLRGKTILLADHAGSRIKTDLETLGFAVRVLEDRTWVRLSDRIRVLTVPDYNQDSILLVEIGDVLVVDLNDASARGWGSFVRGVVSGYDTSILLALSGFNDTDMIHMYDESGRLVPPVKGAPVGCTIARLAGYYGTTHFLPFSSMHRYQRRDSAWASAYTTHLDDYAKGFDSATCRLLPAFVRFSALTKEHEEIRPRAMPEQTFEPEVFGDRWSDHLEKDEAARVATYFRSIERLHAFLGFVNVRVGGVDNVVSLGKRDRGVTFEVPRASLMTAIDHRVFDDLLIGNFMKTTLHGHWPVSGLYPDFTPYVAKYADNGNARTDAEVARYFEAYRRRSPLQFLRHRLEETSKDLLRSRLDDRSLAFRFAKRVYWGFKQV